MADADFWNAAYWAVTNWIRGYSEKETREWQRTSWLASFVLAPHVKQPRQAAPEKLLPFAWQITAPPKPVDQAKMRRDFAEMDKFIAAQKKGNG